MPRYIERKTRESKVPEGWYEAKVGAVDELKGVETIYGMKDKLVVSFKIANGQEQPAVIKKRYNNRLHQKSAFYAFVKEVTGEAPEG